MRDRYGRACRRRGVPARRRPTQLQRKNKERKAAARGLTIFLSGKRGAAQRPAHARPDPFLLPDVKPAIIQQYEENV